MGPFDAFAAIFLAAGPFLMLLSRGRLRRSEEECLSLLKVWAEENGLILLRHRLWGMISGFELGTSRALYRVTVEDQGGRSRAGWASISGRWGAPDFIPRGVEVSLGRARNAPRSKKPRSGNKIVLLWDDWVDG